MPVSDFVSNMFNDLRKAEREASEFARSIGAKDNGSNSFVEPFLQSMNNLRNSVNSFTVSDAYYFCQFKDIPAPETKKLFEAYCNHMEKTGRIKKIVPSCYDGTLWVFV